MVHCSPISLWSVRPTWLAWAGGKARETGIGKRNILVVLGDADTDVAAPDLSPTKRPWLKGRIALHLASSISTVIGPRLNGWLSLSLGGRGAAHVDQILFDCSANLLAAAEP